MNRLEIHKQRVIITLENAEIDPETSIVLVIIDGRRIPLVKMLPDGRVAVWDKLKRQWSAIEESDLH